MLNPRPFLFGPRLAAFLVVADLSQQQLAGRISSSAPRRAGRSIQPSLVARWISGVRDPAPRLADILQAARLEMRRLWSPTDAGQEARDWLGLLQVPLTPNWEKQLRRWFPDCAPPLWTAPAAWLEWPAHYVARPALTDALLLRLLNPDATAAFRRGGVALTGPAGAGKTSLARETVLVARPFFAGGILYGNMGEHSSADILRSWAGDLGVTVQKKC